MKPILRDNTPISIFFPEKFVSSPKSYVMLGSTAKFLVMKYVYPAPSLKSVDCIFEDVVFVDSSSELFCFMLPVTSTRFPVANTFGVR